jgi:hypothetical protein
MTNFYGRDFGDRARSINAYSPDFGYKGGFYAPPTYGEGYTQAGGYGDPVGGEFGAVARDPSLIDIVSGIADLAETAADAYRTVQGLPVRYSKTRYAGDELGRGLSQRRATREREQRAGTGRVGAEAMASAIGTPDPAINTDILKELLFSPNALKRLFSNSSSTTIDPNRVTAAPGNSEPQAIPLVPYRP